MVERGGFEPPKASPADLQSAPFGHSGTSPHCYLVLFILTENPEPKELLYVAHKKREGNDFFATSLFLSCTSTPVRQGKPPSPGKPAERSFLQPDGVAL